MMLAILSARATALSTFWAIAVLGSAFSALAVGLGTIFRKAWLWRTAIVLIGTTLFAAVSAAVLDHLGYAH